MRFLILALVAYIAAVVSFWRPKTLDSPEAEPDAPPEPELDTTLSARLIEAATTFQAAAEQSRTAPPLSTALTGIAAECGALARRADDDAGFAERSRVSITRLLLPLYEVARRSTALAGRPQTAESKALLANATDLLTRSAEALRASTERADASALRHLEADLEVLEDRLPKGD